MALLRTRLHQLREVAAVANNLRHEIVTHPEGRDHKIRAIGRVVAADVYVRLTGEPVTTTIGDSLRVAVDVRVASHKPLFGRLPDHAELSFLRRVVRPGDLFLDVGANIGTYSLMAAECGASVLAFEPGIAAGTLLAHNVAANGLVPGSAVPARAGGSVTVRPVAVGALPGEVTFRDGAGTMAHVVRGADDIARSRAGAFTGQRGSHERTVPVTTIDVELHGRWAIGAKLDVEGFEADVIAGAAATLAEGRIGYLQIEHNTRSDELFGRSADPVFSALRDHRYTLHRLESGALVPEPFPPTAREVLALAPDGEVGRRLDGAP